jgi:hypothetical protein
MYVWTGSIIVLSSNCFYYFICFEYKILQNKESKKEDICLYRNSWNGDFLIRWVIPAAV